MQDLYICKRGHVGVFRNAKGFLNSFSLMRSVFLISFVFLILLSNISFFKTNKTHVPKDFSLLP